MLKEERNCCAEMRKLTKSENRAAEKMSTKKKKTYLSQEIKKQNNLKKKD